MPGLKKRFIGHLQSNKVKKCVNNFDTIDSIHSLKLLRKISSECEKVKKIISVFLEVNTSEESQKKGFSINNKEEMLRCFEVKNVQIKGLMTMAPYTKNEKKLRLSFSLLRNLRGELNGSLSEKPLKHLSMGMSGDYEIAIEEGSTMVRLGTVLFGKR